MSFRTFDFKCPECDYREDHTFDLRGMSEDEKNATIDSGIKCPNCDHPQMNRIWVKAPSGRVADKAGDIVKMKKSFQERFIKHELDDVRHKKGRMYDESIRSAAAQKIEQDVKND